MVVVIGVSVVVVVVVVVAFHHHWSKHIVGLGFILFYEIGAIGADGSCLDVVLRRCRFSVFMQQKGMRWLHTMASDDDDNTDQLQTCRASSRSLEPARKNRGEIPCHDHHTGLNATKPIPASPPRLVFALLRASACKRGTIVTRIKMVRKV